MEAAVPQMEATRPRPTCRIDPQRKTPAETLGFIAVRAQPVTRIKSEKPPGAGAAESIVYTGLENVELVIGKRTATAKVHHVVLNLRSPVVPQSIFGPDAKHPATDGLIDRDRAEPDAIYAAAGGCACVSPRAAKFAIDEPTIEGVTEPRSKRGDPIEARVNAPGHDGSRADDRRARAVLYGRPLDIGFYAQYPLIDL